MIGESVVFGFYSLVCLFVWIKKKNNAKIMRKKYIRPIFGYFFLNFILPVVFDASVINYCYLE